MTQNAVSFLPWSQGGCEGGGGKGRLLQNVPVRTSGNSTLARSLPLPRGWCGRLRPELTPHTITRFRVLAPEYDLVAWGEGPIGAHPLPTGKAETAAGFGHGL